MLYFCASRHGVPAGPRSCVARGPIPGKTIRRAVDEHDLVGRVEDGQGQRSEVRRLPLHRHERQGAARLGADLALRPGQVRRGPRVRRVVGRRVEGHRGVGHDPDAGPEHRVHRPVPRGDHRLHHLRRDRAVGRQGLRARPAVARAARRGLPQVVGRRRYRLLRPGARVLHLRPGALGRRHVGLLRQDRLRGSVVVDRPQDRRRQPRRTVRPSRAATSRCRRSTRCRTCAARCA